MLWLNPSYLINYSYLLLDPENLYSGRYKRIGNSNIRIIVKQTWWTGKGLSKIIYNYFNQPELISRYLIFFKSENYTNSCSITIDWQKIIFLFFFVVIDVFYKWKMWIYRNVRDRKKCVTLTSWACFKRTLYFISSCGHCRSHFKEYETLWPTGHQPFPIHNIMFVHPDVS